MFLKLHKCAHSSTYPTGIFFYVLSALYVFRPFLQRHARSAVFFFFHVGQRFHNNMSFSLEFFMESDFKEDDARQSTRLFCMHEKCFKSKGQTLPNLFVQNFYSSLFYGIKDCHLKPLGSA